MTCLTNHTQVAHAQPAITQGILSVRPKPAPVQRPEIDLGTSESEWNFFIAEFDRYKRTTGITGQTILDELWHCQTKQLRILLQSDTNVTTLDTEEKLRDKLKSLAVTTLHSSVHLIALRDLQQGSTEGIRAFVARCRATASNCGLTKKCQGCQEEVSFIEETLFGVVLAGLHDGNIQQKVLSLAAMKTITKLEELVKYVAAEESGKSERGQFGTSNILAGVRARSAYRSRSISQDPPDPPRDPTRKCKNCGAAVHGTGSYNDRLKLCPAQGKTCAKCQKKNHFSTVCKSKQTSAQGALHQATEAAIHGAHGSLAPSTDIWEEPDEISEEESFIADDGNLTFFSIQQQVMPAITTVSQLSSVAKQIRSNGANLSTIPLPHSIHSAVRGWMSSNPKSSPTHPVQLKVHKPSYKELNLPLPCHNPRNKPNRSVKDNPVFDSGAQMNITSIKTINEMGYNKASLFPVSMGIEGASKEAIHIIGGIILEVRAINEATRFKLSTYQLFYVSDKVTQTYLSRDCCEQLQTLPPNFPTIGSCPPPLLAATMSPSLPPPPCSNSGVSSPGELTCNCPRRSLPPEDAPSLPCEATEENLPKLREYILNRFSASAFNMCEKQKLPLVQGSEPLKLYVDPTAKPIAIRTPAQVPLAWHASVREGLERDVRLGVLERVPLNTPDKWCSRMHIVPKLDGSPRRVVDYTLLNKHAPRQTHHTEAPWAIAAAIPPNTVKTVLDCWNGYHSIPIAPEDRHLTTFLTPWGKMRYITTPQGFISAGDGYTDRTDRITSEFKDVKKCVDDSVLWSSTIEENFFKVCSYLQRCASHGIIFNKNKTWSSVSNST